MSSQGYYYFKSRPGTLWVLIRETGAWVKLLTFNKMFDPDCITIRTMNQMEKDFNEQ